MFRDVMTRIIAGVVVVLILFFIGKIFGVALIGAAGIRAVAKKAGS